MKTKIYKITFALLLPVIFYVIVSGFIKTKEGEIVSKSKISPPPVTTSKDFTNILLNTSYRNSPCVWDLENHLKQYQELNFNGIHMYDWGSDKFGQFIPALTTTQINNLNELIYRSDTSGLKTVFERTKITRLCYGQRLEYEVVQNTGDSVTNFGFCYKNRDSNVGSYQTDSGRTVLHSETNPTLESPNSAGWLCKDIYENMQHTDLYYFLQSADTADWFLKPMMRIRQTDFNVNSTTPVVAIISYNFRGYPIDTVVIRVNNFRNSSGNYEGNYTNSYTFLINNDSLIVKGSLDSNSTISGLNYGYGGNEGVNGFDRYNVKQCKVDFRVYWFGQVDVWFDKLTVDDRFANILFNPNTSLNYDSNIEDEVSHFGDSLDIFFADELVYSQLPCFKYVQDKLRTLNSGTKLSYAISNNLNHYSLRNEDNVFNYHLSETNPDIIQIDAHAFPVYDNQGAVPINAIQNYDSRIPQAWRATNDNYNNYLQKVLGYRGYYSDFPNEGSFIYQITTTHDQVAQMTTPAKFIVQPQIQHWMSADATGFKSGGNREPLNEEIQVQAGIAIAHGAESLSWFTFESDSTVSGSYNGACNASPNPYQRINFPVTLPVSPDYFIWFGLLNKYPDTTKRTKNIYGQDKWNYVKNLNKKILHWKPTLDKITWQDGYSVHSETADHYFISDIKSIRRNPSLEYDEDYPFTYYDATNERYWEMGFFNPDDASDKSKYFLMVNRRCVPDINNDGDVRGLRIKFDSTELAGFINWKIIELDTNNVVATFNKNTTSYINMGEFNPGEGKLYKLAPVMQEGGELVADESCFSSFNCRGEVYSEGFDIRLNPGTEISFSENGRLAMNGGSFISGYTESNQSNSPVILKGLSSQKWKGVSFNNCVEVNVINTSFSGISPEESGAVQLTNCLNTSIISSLFNSTDSVKTALSVDYILNGGEWNVSLYLKNNQFINTVNSLKVISYGSTVIPVTIDGNSFAASIMGYNAVTLSNIAAGIIKNNFIGNYRNSINMICCTADLYRNVISCSYSGSVSISPSGMSCLNFGKSGDYYTGGINSIESDETNINTDNSDFNLNKGYNTFNILNSSSSAYHFTGTFPESSGDTYLRASKNCFQINSLDDNPLSSIVYNGTNIPVEFEFIPASCNPFEPGEYTILTVNGRNDTIYYENEPSGAGETENAEEMKSGTSNSETESLYSLYDSAKISARIRDYETAKLKCEEILNSFADSIEAVNVISELYLSFLNSGNTGSRMSELESYLEAVILNHTENEALVDKCFYFMQKCKVSEGEYESAMTGFSQIVNQNPYSYEGLIASWDYAAASLLAGDSGGTGAGKREIKFTNNELQIKETEELREYSEEELMEMYVLNDDPVIKNDKEEKTKNTEKTTTLITKTTAGEDRQKFRLSVFNSLKTRNETDKDRMNKLEEKAAEGAACEREKSDLKKMKTLREIIRLRKPADMREHISKVNSDLNRLSEAMAENNKIKYSSSFPEEYRLYQNYPNPFNPVTNVEFGISKSGFVTLKVYVILGKEVATLVNEILSPGKYTVNFNGSNFASGVYFYRMEYGEFKDIKRMVLIK